MKKISNFIILLIVLLSASCATIFSGSRQQVAVSSNPPTARVFVNGQDAMASTPCYLDLKRKSKQNITLKKDGYEDVNLTIKGKFNATTLVNFLGFGFFGPIGIGIDYATGAAYRYSPSIYGELSITNSNTKNQSYTNDIISNKNNMISNYRKVAIFDPEGKGVDLGIKSIVREEISSVFVNNGYVVVERALISKVLEENKFQSTGHVDDAQIGELGRKMGATTVCVSSIAQMGNVFHISCKMVDVSSGLVERQFTGKTSPGGGDLDQVVYNITKRMIER